ncbi:MAG: portal protein [Spirochaetae bacterium HGW-Spirochaetae-5]|nr:MAG: portal protein [Spirochaetae bacterium HGW-Spirochaetae-5]
MGIAGDIIIIIVFGLAAGLLFNMIKLPPIIGYIIAGIVIGPFTGGISVSDIPRIELLAEIGVALLLFSIGLDLSFRELKDVRNIAIIGTVIQIILCIILGLGFGYFMDLPVNVSIVFGMIISLSSTMVVIKVLMSRGLIGTLSSKVMIGMLIVQDLAAIPMMIVIPQLQNMTGNLPVIGLTILKAALVLVIIIVIGVRLIPFILKYVAKLNSRELFLITITAIGLGIGYVTHMFGLSLAFGAFVAGMVISESDYSHQALNDIIPLRDVFGLVFFTSIGMLLDPKVISENIATITTLVFLIVAGKFLIFSSLAMIFKYRNIIPLALGLGLAQIGEFSFVLARTGEQAGVIDKNFYSLVLAVSVITMILSPFLSMLSTPLYSLKRKWFTNEQVQTINMPVGGLSNHVLIAGGGRVGSQISDVLSRLNFPFIIIEQDFRRFEKAKNDGYPVIYGDAGQETVLTAADIHRAKLLIITAPSIITAREVLAVVEHHNPEIDVIVRANDLDQIKELQKLNITEIVQPEFEASLEIIRQALLHLDCQVTGIQNIIDEMRRGAYSSGSNQLLNVSSLSKLKDTPFLLETGWYEIKEGDIFEGKSAIELDVRKQTGISIVGLMRDGVFTPNPEPVTVFKSGDIIAVIGIPEQRKIFENIYFKNSTWYPNKFKTSSDKAV